MTSKRRRQTGGSSRLAAPATSRATPAAASQNGALPAGSRAQIGLIVVALILLSAVVIGADFIIGQIAGQGAGSAASPTPAASATPAASSSQVGVVMPGRGGSWTNVQPDELARMLAHKDFTLIDVKTPYIGEIDGTDLYIPYDQLSGRASQLPSDKGARILVYCRSGVQSAQAAQTLLDLGYTNVWNLDGGMNAWQASGRTLVKLNRQ